MDWQRLVRRYVWDDERTPYFVPAARLSPGQARYELFAYALFLSVAAAVAAVAMLAAGRNPALVGFALSVLVAAVALGVRPTAPAAGWCAAAPALVVLFVAAEAAAGRIPAEKAAVVGLAAAGFLWYGRRIVAIVRRRQAG